MSTQTKRSKTICFAYFGDGQFLGWYADTFGSIRPESPKLYGDSLEMVEQITASFRRRVAEMKAPKEEGQEEGPKHMVAALIANSTDNDKDELRKYQSVELRIVECPYYDGPNPDFDKAAHELALEEYRKGMEKAGIFEIPGPSIERSAAVNEYHRKYPRPKADNWIYCDYTLVKAWAATPPTEFLAIIPSE